MVDMISTLPDEVLCHILSFLPTQISASTSILSKRWTPLWLSVPTLYFDDKTYLLKYKPYHCFRNFINLTFLTRNLHLPITTFHLQCEDSNFDVSDHDLKIWLNAAMQRGGLENLHIQLPDTVAILRLKSCIFTCKTLVVLKFFGLEVDEFSFVDLPSLKTLQLNDIAFPEPQYLVKLLSGCPNLED
ncbi:putative F-box/LRR-repeat protein At5g41840, partial [Lotus japonicus]|uniref:putative F-box/LRR-repeat protein At5g41840 n=1 Tax=Lotus japonicus TaxID=34305 RepID=UPI00258D56CE